VSKADVSLIDYGINNLKSVAMAFQKIGKCIEIISTPEEVMRAKCLVLPGIGAFRDGMQGLHDRNLVTAIKKKVASGTPLLGICLGMQMLFSESEEFGLNQGLDLIKGRVVPFKSPNEVKSKRYKIPHMGWNEIHKINNWKGTLLSKTDAGSCVYFVHSFYPKVEDESKILAKTKYHGQEFVAVVKNGNVVGTQFHPEKSGSIGLKIIENYCKKNGI
jgi:imidazole glycerol-phosphate synthase subunit HisH